MSKSRILFVLERRDMRNLRVGLLVGPNIHICLRASQSHWVDDVITTTTGRTISVFKKNKDNLKTPATNVNVWNTSTGQTRPQKQYGSVLGLKVHMWLPLCQTILFYRSFIACEPTAGPWEYFCRMKSPILCIYRSNSCDSSKATSVCVCGAFLPCNLMIGLRIQNWVEIFF